MSNEHKKESNSKAQFKCILRLSFNLVAIKKGAEAGFWRMRSRQYSANLVRNFQIIIRQQLMIFATFVRVNDYDLYAQQQLLSHVSVANQRARTTLSTVLVYTKYIQDYPLTSLAGHNLNHVLPSVYMKKAALTIIKKPVEGRETKPAMIPNGE